MFLGCAWHSGILTYSLGRLCVEHSLSSPLCCQHGDDDAASAIDGIVMWMCCVHFHASVCFWLTQGKSLTKVWVRARERSLTCEPREEGGEQEQGRERLCVEGEMPAESSEEQMASIDARKQPRSLSFLREEFMRARQEPDNFHQVHLPTVSDVGALAYLLESKGIVPLVWGEMAALAYQSRTVPLRLFFIIRDRLFDLALDTLTRAGLERKTTYFLGDMMAAEMALHRPYVRFSLRQPWPGAPVQTYLQLFSASQVGLASDSRAWDDAKPFSVGSEFPSLAVLRHFGLRPKRHYKFLVTPQADFFAISLHLMHTTLTEGFHDAHVLGALLCLNNMTKDALASAADSPLEFADIYVPEKYAELAFLLLEGLLMVLRAIEERDPRGSRLRTKQDGVGTSKRVYLRTWATEA